LDVCWSSTGRRACGTPTWSGWRSSVSRVPGDAPSIMLAAGEASGDLHGAALCRALRAEAPGYRLYGMGGARMADAGMDLLVDVTAAAVAGGTEALNRIPVFYRAYRRLRRALDGARRPRVLVVIDSPEFNLRLAREARFVLALAPTVELTAVERRLGAGGPVAIAHDRTHAVMRAADLLLVASGTATLEAALLGTPMVVCYRVSRLTELMVRSLMRVPWISLPNLTLGRAVVPELYQEDATGERLGREALRLLDSPGALDTQRAAFRELQGQLGEPGVGERAARLVL